MNIDVNKIQTVLIYDEHNRVVDRFELSSMALIKDKINGHRLELKKYVPKDKQDGNN